MDFLLEVRDAATDAVLNRTKIDGNFSGNRAVAVFRDALKRAKRTHPGVTLRHNVPVVEHLDAKILAAVERAGADKLTMHAWHARTAPNEWCGTAHCRAGWAEVICLRETGVHLPVDPEVNGHLLYAAARPGKKLPNFGCSSQEALDSLERDAAADPLPPGPEDAR